MIDLKGIYPALVTPFTKDNKINEESLRKLVRMNINKDVRGFYVGGSTGEAFLLSTEERKRILEVVADEVQGKCTIIAHVGCISTDQAVELGLHAKEVGVDAISSIPPFYYKFCFNEIRDYYLNIVNETGLPMIVYNFPALSGVELTQDNISQLRENGHIIGIKHTSMNLFQVERMKTTDKELIVLNGYDQVFLGGLSMGADGAIGSTFNFMADKFIKINELFKNGRLEEAREIQIQANEIISVLVKTGVFQGIKHILESMGIECNGCRRPFKNLNKEEKHMLNGLIPML